MTEATQNEDNQKPTDEETTELISEADSMVIVKNLICLENLPYNYHFFQGQDKEEFTTEKQ